jgi:para-aminobenzoate synthetase component I
VSATYYDKIAFKGKLKFHVKIFDVREIPFSANQLVNALLNLPKEQNVCLLDSCGVSHLGSHFLIAGFNPVEIFEINEKYAQASLKLLEQKLSTENLAGFLTISYEFGLKLNRIVLREKEFSAFDEPDIFLALFDSLIIHDYDQSKTFLVGDEKRFDEIEKILLNSPNSLHWVNPANSKISSNFTRENYISAIKQIQEHIRNGDTYQTNLTQQLRVKLPDNLTPEQIFFNLRKNHPAPFASFIRRKNDVVISASPERFFKVQSSKLKIQSRSISTSPIKGTMRRGKTESEDARLREELLKSEKDRAENVMIVDLLRNDLGRICKFGTVEVEKLCELEIHPTLYHLVSTIRGELRENANLADILRAVFPCGSITGAPKIRTMQLIDQLETAPRGLSMGAIGYSIQNSKFKIQNLTDLPALDFSVAIRTMVVRGKEAVFNVGGGIVIDSVPEKEYEETIVKAQALLNSINANQELFSNLGV